MVALFLRKSNKTPTYKLPGQTTIDDKEFGEITVKRAKTRYLRLRVEPDGKIMATIPYYATLIALRGLIDKNRRMLRKNIAALPKKRKYSDEQVEAIRDKAKAFLPARVEFLAKKNGLKYTKVTCRNQKTRWGSCSREGNISLNIALVTLRPELIDYVILHELVHTVEMNHSEEFWRKLAQACPDYKKLRKNLRSHTPYLQ